MAMAIQGAFTGGILDPALSARVDLAKYVTGCRELENFVVQAHGGIYRRPGTEFIVGISGEGVPRLIPFQFNVEQAYILVFTDNKMYVIKRQNGVSGVVEDPGNPGDPYVVATPYTDAQIFGISYAQSADTMYLCHADVVPYKLTRTADDDWTLATVTFGTTLATAAAGTATWHGTAGTTTIKYKVCLSDGEGDASLPSPSFQVTTGQAPGEWVAGNYVSLKLSGNYITGISKADPGVVTCVGHGLVNGDIVYLSGVKRMTEVNDQSFEVTKLTNDAFSIGVDTSGYTAFTVAISNITNASPAAVTALAHGFATGDVVHISGVTGMTLAAGDYTITRTGTNTFTLNGVDTTSSGTYTASSGVVYCTGGYITPYAAEYLVYKERDGYYGFVGATPSPFFTDLNYTPDLNDTPPENYNPFTATNPYSVAFFEQRLWYGGSDDYPQSVWGSRVGLFDSFNKSRPQLESDSLEFTLASTQVNAIRWIAPFGDLLIGTQGAEWKLGALGEGAITPSTVNAKTQSYWGSAPNLQPIVIGNSVLHVQHKSGKVRDLFYSLEKDGYQGNDLSVLAAHLFDGKTIVSWTYQGAPESVIWCVLSDGTMLALTYLKEHQVWAWSKHTTDGEFKAVSCIPGETYDDVYTVVERGASYFIERMVDRWYGDIEDAIFLDSSISKSSAVAFTVVDGLGHLEGETVSALVDGAPVSGLTVTGGEVTLPYAVKKAVVGLPYTSILRTMSIELNQGATIGKIKKINSVTARFQKTVGGKMGPALTYCDALRFTPSVYGEAIQPSSILDYEFVFPAGYDRDGSVYVIQDQCLPMTILALMLDVSTED